MRTAIVKSFITAAAVLAAGSAAATGTWETTLQERDLNNDSVIDAYYDTTLNISWLADANVIGAVEFAEALDWAKNLNIGGVTGWTLPTIHIDTCQTGSSFWDGGGVCGYGVQTWTSDMAHMNMVTLGNASYSGYLGDYGIGPGIPDGTNLLSNTGPFSNLQGLGYWFSQDYSINPYNTAEVEDLAWRYSFHAGRQDPLSKSDHLYAWAVHSGDVGMMMAAVPEPETYALMLAGLSTVALVARRRRRDEI